jgi:hypothetical protein
MKPPHRDAEISEMRNSCLKKLFPSADDLKTIEEEYAEFAHLIKNILAWMPWLIGRYLTQRHGG